MYDDEIFGKNIINYLNDFITWNTNQYKSCPILMMTICIDEDLNDIHPCTRRPPNIEDKTFPKLFQNDIYKLMNICKHAIKFMLMHWKKLCMYGFLQPLINEIHF